MLMFSVKFEEVEDSLPVETPVPSIATKNGLFDLRFLKGGVICVGNPREGHRQPHGGAATSINLRCGRKAVGFD